MVERAISRFGLRGTRGVANKSVAYTVLILDVGWILRVGFNFTTQVRDINTRVMMLVRIGCTPYLFEQRLKRQHFAGAFDERDQEFILSRREANFLSGDPYTPRF